MPKISPKAIVVDPAGLADDVRVGPFSFVGADVTVGSGTVIANSVTVTGKTRIGRSCRLLPGCIVGCAPRGVSDDSAGPCTIGDHNTIREHVTIETGCGVGADTSTMGDNNTIREPVTTEAGCGIGPGTIVGDHNLLMVGCHVGHDAQVVGQGIFANFTHVENHALVDKYVRTSAFTTVSAYATVGAYTFTTGYSGVDRDAPPYAIVQGFPFRVRGINRENLRRCGFNQQSIDILKRVFRTIFNGEGLFPSPERLGQIERDHDDEYVRHLIASLRRSAASPGGRSRQPAR